MPESIDGYQLKQDFWTRQQREAFVKSKDKKYFAYFMDPRTGKSKPNVDKACYLYERKSHPLNINAVLIIAWPDGVHRGWITDAFPENVPSRIRWKGMVWRANKAKQVGFKQQFKELCAYKGLAVFAVNAESLIGLDTRKAIGAFLAARGKVFVIGDETSFMAEPGSRRAEIMLNIGDKPQCVVKSILDGTPIDGNPFGYFSQIKFLHWSILGHHEYLQFKHHFAQMKHNGDREYWIEFAKHKEAAKKKGLTNELAIENYAKRHAHGTGRHWTAIEQDQEGKPIFKNLVELWAKLDPISYRATYEQCFDTPRKIETPHYFQLTPEIRRVYDELKETYKAELRDGTVIEATHQLTRMLRAQQVASNYYPEQKTLTLHEECGGEGCDDCDHTGVVESVTPMRIIDPNCNPRLEALRAELLPGKQIIVWCRFNQDCEQVFALAKSMGRRPCRYDGSTGATEKADSKDGFQEGRYDTFISKERSGGRGLPLWKAYGHVYYSCGFSRRDRKQSSDRAEHPSRTVGTSIVTLVAEETVDDMTILPALRNNMEISAMIMRDPKKEWI